MTIKIDPFFEELHDKAYKGLKNPDLIDLAHAIYWIGLGLKYEEKSNKVDEEYLDLYKRAVKEFYKLYTPKSDKKTLERNLRD